jgi:hypothetical protein
MKYKILVLTMLIVFCVSYGYEGEMPELKNSATAAAYSMGATILPAIPLWVCLASENCNEFSFWGSFAISVSGIIVGPSAGHFYAGNRSRGLKSIGFRAVSGGTFLLSSYGTFCSIFDENFENTELYFWIAIVSGVATVGSVVFDIWTCPNSVEKYNRSVRNYRGFYLSPEIDIKDESYGLSLSYRF